MKPSSKPGKAEEARVTIERCRKADGFQASTQNYPELWVRDLVYSEEALLKLGYGDTVKRQLEAFAALQRRDGNLPTVIAPAWRRPFNQRYHFWTCDTEVLFILGSFWYVDHTGDMRFLDAIRDHMDRCLSFVEGRMDKSGFVPGSDWRDAIIGLEKKCLLSNQVQLVSAYDLLGYREKAEALKEKIRDTYYLPEKGFFADSVWVREGDVERESRFDCLGSALGIMNGTISGEAVAGTCAGFKLAETEQGYRNVVPSYQIARGKSFSSVRMLNAYFRNGAWVRNRRGHYQNSAIWPFVEARVVAALRGLGLDSAAERASEKILARRGIYEWYSPVTGEPRGSSGQLWTAAAVFSQL